MSAILDYSRVFNHLNHMVVLRAEGRTEGAVEGLITTVLAIDAKLKPSSVEEIADAVREYFGISLPAHLLQRCVDRLRGRKILQVERGTGCYTLSSDCRTGVLERIENASDLECEVQTEWLASIEARIGKLDTSAQEQLWRSLRGYMARVFRRHGAETVQLLDPRIHINGQDTKPLGDYLVSGAE